MLVSLTSSAFGYVLDDATKADHACPMSTMTARERDERMTAAARLEAAADRVEQVEAIIERRRRARMAKDALTQRDRDYAERAAEAAEIAPW